MKNQHNPRTRLALLLFSILAAGCSRGSSGAPQSPVEISELTIQNEDPETTDIISEFSVDYYADPASCTLTVRVGSSSVAALSSSSGGFAAGATFDGDDYIDLSVPYAPGDSMGLSVSYFDDPPTRSVNVGGSFLAPPK